MGVIGLGNALMDIVVHIDDDQIIDQLSLAKAGMTMIDLQTHHQIVKLIENKPYSYVAGGSAANTLNGLVNLGGKGAFIGKVGRDVTGEQFSKDQQDNNIVPYLEISDSDPSGKCVSLVHPDGERTMATYLGAAITMTPMSVTQESLDGYKVLYMEGYLVYNRDLVESAMIKAKEQGLKVALDLSSYNVVDDNIEYLNYLVDKYVDIIFANKEEACSFTGCDPEQALEVLAARCEVAVVKVGAKGSLVGVAKERFKAGVIDAVAVDKTGAGDLYAAGFLWGYCKGLDSLKSAKIGAVLSSKVIEVMGTKMDTKTWNEIRTIVHGIENGMDPKFLYL